MRPKTTFQPKPSVNTSTDSRDPRHFHERSARHFDSGEMEDALINSLQAVELTYASRKPNPWFVRHLMRLFIERKQPNLSLMVCRRAIGLGADNYIMALQHSRCLVMLKRQREALSVLEDAMSKESVNKSEKEDEQIKSYIEFLETRQ